MQHAADTSLTILGRLHARLGAAEGLSPQLSPQLSLGKPQEREQLAKALRALHAIGVAHRGIEPGCVFVDANNDVRLGLPKDLRGIDVGDGRGFAPTLIGPYSAPELLDTLEAAAGGSDDDDSDNRDADAEAGKAKAKAGKAASSAPLRLAPDVYSLGAVVYHLASGEIVPRDIALSRLVARPKVKGHQTARKGGPNEARHGDARGAGLILADGPDRVKSADSFRRPAMVASTDALKGKGESHSALSELMAMYGEEDID